MKAIQVRYLAATNYRGTRVKAFAEGGFSVTLARDYELTFDGNARVAAQALIDKMKWNSKINGSGYLPNGDAVFTLGY